MSRLKIFPTQLIGNFIFLRLSYKQIAPHGFIVGNAAPEKGKGGRYGSVLLDVRQ